MGTLLGLELQQVFALEGDAAARDLVVGIPDEDGGEGALTRAVGSHDGVDLAFIDGEADPLEYFLISYASMEVLYLKHILSLMYDVGEG